ncbi:hypothetical protein LNJ05_12835 [Tenacibaculum finnmarkense genomovar ulcerans]|uniref:hypothetical protein n=1 Tax=Tenacibaculum finnmarkense TaxID=2781243 RepID=UPI00187B3452|nr:hypothetical protein [Tenacibaculum finnmarkense]MBE7646751.1 hypothetical protein [Tenacibaculum finnmarkense genomovar ulcerans]MCD8433649.1 hypothetical protein [Tenacibaculum finnmarkense genomovar ulcerans]
MISKKIGFILTLFFVIISCSTYKKAIKTNPEKRLKDSLAFELCQIYGSDQGVRDMKLLTTTKIMKFLPNIDTISFNKLVKFVKKNGYPTKKILGEDNFSFECVESAGIAVLLHNPHRLVNEKKYLDLFLNEVEKGNFKRKSLALVLDKYYWVRRDKFGNRKLLYGSQFGKPCFKHRAKSDSVRAIIGLKPLTNSDFMKCKK